MKKWEAQRQALQAAQQTIEGRLERTHQYGLKGAMNEELGELSINDNHPADIASELFERSKDVGLRDADKIRLQEIERALAGIDTGTYGTCTNCGKAIPQERLEAFPLATLCIDCKLTDEHHHPSRERPVEEEFLYPGFARTDTDETSSVVFDGEDAWQAVGRYNERPSYKGDYEQIFMDDNEGIVDDMDVISNQEYRNQLPD
ncbi:MAG: hypothetical protein A2201_06955 [Alicyclobacillus sp. RIFOXYA1_FULL_53_8]|nr:MAG: hypothetical protein A2201_06955 [Alicyclobacillus sp. RIFOXYA1_FULL_53_8]